MFRKIASLLLVFSICFSLASCALPSGIKQEIPELVKMEGFLEKKNFDAYLFYQEEDKMTRYCSNITDKETYKEMQKTMRKVVSCKGTKATDFTADKITYPVISLIVSPKEFGEENEPGESVVWTNGYLITEGGDVYKCDMDFDPIIKESLNFRKDKYDRELTAATGAFRNLAMANGEWNKDLLKPTTPEMLKTADNVKAKAVREFEDERGKWVTIEFDNYSDKDWKFSHSHFLSIEIEGAYYSIPSDPVFDTYAIGTMSYQYAALKHDTTTQDYRLNVYGEIPPGDYTLLVPAESGSDRCYVMVEYSVK